MIIHAVIPSFRVEKHILDVLSRIGPEVTRVWVVDDKCPNGSGLLVKAKSRDKRVSVVFHDENLGVGGAVITGYRMAVDSGADVVVKIDGDGQMHPEDVPKLLKPILDGNADYVKGNRFDSIAELKQMPLGRIFGNAALSLTSKISTGYWRVNDPTNGFTAIHRLALQKIELEKVSKRYFFESDLLFRLSLVGAVVKDVSIPAHYGDEISNLNILRVLLEFPLKHTKNFLKRIGYQYFLREWSIGSVNLIAGLSLLSIGSIFGFVTVLSALERSQPTTAGQVTFASLAIILGFQLLLSFVSYDIQSEPREPIRGR